MIPADDDDDDDPRWWWCDDDASWEFVSIGVATWIRIRIIISLFRNYYILYRCAMNEKYDYNTHVQNCIQACINT